MSLAPETRLDMLLNGTFEIYKAMKIVAHELWPCAMSYVRYFVGVFAIMVDLIGFRLSRSQNMTQHTCQHVSDL